MFERKKCHAQGLGTLKNKYHTSCLSQSQQPKWIFFVEIIEGKHRNWRPSIWDKDKQGPPKSGFIKISIPFWKIDHGPDGRPHWDYRSVYNRTPEFMKVKDGEILTEVP